MGLSKSVTYPSVYNSDTDVLPLLLIRVRSAYRDALLESSNKIKNQNRMELLPQVDDASRPAVSAKHSGIDGTIGSRREQVVYVMATHDAVSLS
jgi:hypothetical protein